MPAPRWMQHLAIAGVLLCFMVVVLGAYVRLTVAGLGCPDWPGCYGHLTPLSALLLLATLALLRSVSVWRGNQGGKRNENTVFTVSTLARAYRP